MSVSQKYRPLITSFAFNNQNVFLPYRYNFSIEQIVEIKKFLPKNLFKLHGIDAEDSTLSKQSEQALQKAKLKVKAVKGVSTQTQKPIEFLPKQEVKVIEWYNKSINLQIPYSSKLNESMLQQHVRAHLDYYFDHFMFFKNTLTDEIYSSLASVKISTEKIATETDIVFTCWNVQPEPNDDSVKVIRIDVPVVLCLNLNEIYELTKLKELIKTDILSSISVLLKHGYNTRVITVGQGQKEFVCLNSYCQQENALQEQERLRTIIRQQKKAFVETEETKVAAKNQNAFLFLVLAILVLIYFGLKIFPIHGRDQNQYLINQPSGSGSTNPPFSQENIF